jgi:GT2 family glycosyltransferase
MTSHPVDISVLIVSWNAKHYLQLCLDSLTSAPPRRHVEILVVDNASNDGSREMVKDQYPQVKLVESSENLGFAKGNNLGIGLAKGRYVALVNPDVTVLPGCLDALADFLDQNSQVGNVGPRVWNPDGTIQSSCQRFPTLWSSFCSAMGLAARFRNSRFLRGHEMYCLSDDQPRAVDVLVGCFSMIRREAFEDVGLLDEDLYMYAEDVDWCRRAWSHGWHVIFYPGAQAIHDRSSITAPYPVRFALEQQRSTLRYWRKYHGPPGAWAVRMIMFIHHLLRYGFAVLGSFVRTETGTRCRARKQVSGACLEELLFRKA